MQIRTTGPVWRALRAACLSIAALIQVPAMAQDTADPTVTDHAAFGEIDVTAERREESLQDSSLALQVLSAEEFDRANLTYDSPDRDWSVTAFVRNIGEEAVYAGAGVHAFAPPLTYVTIAPPRTYGVRLRYNFGN